jgi:small-conductance mechanosensitive channel
MQTFHLFKCVVCLLALGTSPAAAQPAAADKAEKPASVRPGSPAPPTKVEVQPEVRDSEIEKRLLAILRATKWFAGPKVEVNDGVVFLDGETTTEEYKQWAEALARATQGVVAVVNRIDIITPTVWDFSPAGTELEDMGRGIVRALPMILVAFIVLALAWGAGRFTAVGLRAGLRRRISSRLLREVTARAAGMLVFLLGLYFVLRLSGLSRLAVTVIGGTGLVGLILGIAFRDITENFLSSLFLSLAHPFREGDLVEIAGTTGYVQRLTSRTTILMTLDGNQVQIPNATVFKSTIRNYTSNPNRREDFTVGIGYETVVPRAQEIALHVLAEHPAVLKEPEPWVLVDNLGPSTVNLRVYFWSDGSKHSWLKVRSSIIRLVKRAFQDAGISLPDEAREIVFPDGVPVRMLDGEPPRPRARQHAPSAETAAEPEVVSTQAEGGLQSEAREIKEQARQAWTPDRGENLLATPKNGSQGATATKDESGTKGRE